MHVVYVNNRWGENGWIRWGVPLETTPNGKVDTPGKLVKKMYIESYRQLDPDPIQRSTPDGDSRRHCALVFDN